ncbi:MAG TPA: hypothetical protein VKG45_09860 [Actinomycetes bacterium]|nr:hypothetical protein [Actinomycetes bacterium]
MADQQPDWLPSAEAPGHPAAAEQQGWERLDWHESGAPGEEAETGSRRPTLRVIVLAAGLSLAVLLLVATLITVVSTGDPTTGAQAGQDQGAGQRDAEPARTESAQFSFTRPQGWVDRTGELADRLTTIPGVSAERVLIGPSSAGVPAHIVVTRTREPVRQRSLDVLRQDFMVGMRARNPTAEPIGSPIYMEVGGMPATSFEFRYQQRGIGIASRAVIVNRHGSAYLMLFETGEVDYDLHVNALWELLESWRWR